MATRVTMAVTAVLEPIMAARIPPVMQVATPRPPGSQPSHLLLKSYISSPRPLLDRINPPRVKSGMARRIKLVVVFSATMGRVLSPETPP